MKQRSAKEIEIEFITEMSNGNMSAFGELYVSYRDCTIKGIHARYPKVPEDIICEKYNDACISLKDNIYCRYIRVENGNIVNKRGKSVSLKGYLFTIVRNKVQDYCDANNITYKVATIDDLKGKKKAVLTISIDSLLGFLRPTDGDDGNFDDGWQREDDCFEDSRIGTIRKALRELSEACRKILYAYYYDELSMKEIAIKLNYSNADTAKQQKSRCFSKFSSYVKTQLNS